MNALTVVKIALCFSGQVRDFSIASSSLRRNILTPLRSHDVYSFAHCAGPSVVSSRDHVFQAVIAEESEPDYVNLLSFDHDVVARPWHDISPLTSYLRQLRGISIADSLRQTFEIENGFTFDWVFRLRFDNLYIAPLEDLSILPADRIYIPAHDNWRGLNDRFAFGPASLMAIYANRLDSAIQRLSDGYSLNPEIFLLDHLRDHSVPIGRTRVSHHLLRYSQLWRAKFLLEQGDDPSFVPSRSLGSIRDKVLKLIGPYRYDKLSIFWWKRP